MRCVLHRMFSNACQSPSPSASSRCESVVPFEAYTRTNSLILHMLVLYVRCKCECDSPATYTYIHTIQYTCVVYPPFHLTFCTSAQQCISRGRSPCVYMRPALCSVHNVTIFSMAPCEMGFTSFRVLASRAEPAAYASRDAQCVLKAHNCIYIYIHINTIPY